MPPHLVRKAARALQAPVSEPVERQIIGSAEVLADVLPKVTAQTLAAGFSDPHLETLYAQAYAAFRRRRSLLLLNLEHQVRFEELPWIAALQRFRAPDAGGQRAARQVLEQGRFTEKRRLAAAAASRSLAGALYARYYDLPGPQSWAQAPAGLPEEDARRWRNSAADDFAALCRSRAAEAQADRAQAGSVAANGTVLEQAQILTTQNLAVLVDALALRERVADRAFGWTVRQQRRLPRDWHARLQAIKNSAYAWRQAIYFLSLCDQPAQAQAG